VSFPSRYGTVGVIKPTYRPGSLEEFIRLLPEGIGVIPLFMDIRKGTTDEFKRQIEVAEERVSKLAEIGVDLIHPEGAPAFMVLGLARERELVRDWQKRFGIPIVTAPQTQVEALRALGARRIVGLTYFKGELNDIFARYFTESGFEVLEMDGISVPFDAVGQLSTEDVFRHARDAALRHPGAEAIYLLGSGWRTLDVIEPLERECGVPVVHAVPARVWAVQWRLGVHVPIAGHGRLLSQLPPPAPSA